MGLLSRFRADPLPPGLVEEPLDKEGLLAIVRSLSELKVRGSIGGPIAYAGNGWAVWDNGVVEDVAGNSRCVSMTTSLLAWTRLDLVESAGEEMWARVKTENVPAVNLLALAVGIASDPDGVDRMAER